MHMAFDIGTKMGLAWTDDEHPESYLFGYLDYTGKQYKNRGVRYLAFRMFLDDWQPVPETIYYERVRRHNGTDAAHVYGGFMAVLEMYCVLKQIPLVGLEVASIKQHATGKGNADKEAMLEAARNEFGYDGDNDNEADALWILDLGVQKSCTHKVPVLV